MKKLVSLVFISLFLSFNSMGQELWKEGTHYNIVAEETTEKREIMEFFSFWCSHCLYFEPVVALLKKEIDDDVEFKKIHVNFMRSPGPDIQDDVTRAMLVGRIYKKEEQIVSAIFNHIHVQRKPISGLNDMKNMLVTSGVDAAAFEKQANGSKIKALLNRNNSMITRYQHIIRGVPSFIINGKYQAVLSGGMKPDDVVALMVWLSEQK